MITKKGMEMSSGETPKKKDDTDDLKRFIQKKQNQNIALKKIIDKLNTDESESINQINIIHKTKSK